MHLPQSAIWKKRIMLSEWTTAPIPSAPSSSMQPTAPKSPPPSFIIPAGRTACTANPRRTGSANIPLTISKDSNRPSCSCLSQAGPAAARHVPGHFHRYHRLYTRGRGRNRHPAGPAAGIPRQPQRPLRPVERPYRRQGSRRDQRPRRPLPDQLPAVRRRHLLLRMVLGQAAPYPSRG